MHESFLGYGRYRHLKAGGLTVVVALVVYLAYQPDTGRSGGSWVGYGLGVLCLALFVWLLWFGVRKRSYRSRGAPLRAWLSAHVYWGGALVALVPLHAAFELGWNVHSLAYALIIAVSLSGILGVALYATVPDQMTANRPGQKLDGLLERVAEIDAELVAMAGGLSDTVAQLVAESIHHTFIGGGLIRQLSGRDPHCGTARAFEQLQRRTAELDDDVAALTDVLGALARKRELLARIRRDAQLKAWLDIWLLVHVPAAVAATVVVGIHVFVVLYYR